MHSTHSPGLEAELKNQIELLLLLKSILTLVQDAEDNMWT